MKNREEIQTELRRKKRRKLLNEKRLNSIQKEFIEDVLTQMWNGGYGSSANSEDDDINEIIELGRLYG